MPSRLKILHKFEEKYLRKDLPAFRVGEPITQSTVSFDSFSLRLFIIYTCIAANVFLKLLKA